jgi:hypothetical protein
MIEMYEKWYLATLDEKGLKEYRDDSMTGQLKKVRDFFIKDFAKKNNISEDDLIKYYQMKKDNVNGSDNLSEYERIKVEIIFISNMIF